jgi:hypothetical protein
MSSTTAEAGEPKEQSQAMTNSETSKMAGAPFNLPSADVVFQTADNVLFHLHKAILSIASPFFADMFSIAQPPPDEIHLPLDQGPVRITEDSQIFDLLLRMFYPVASPALTDRLRIEQMLEVALKYQIDDTIAVLRDAWRLLIPEYPLQIFASACRLRLHEETQLAAKAWKTQAIWEKISIENDPSQKIPFCATMEGVSYVSEMASLSADTYHRFLSFLRTNPDPDIRFIDPPHSTTLKRPVSVHLPPITIESYGTCLPSTDIILRCSDGVDVHVHRLILALSSADKLLAIAVPSLPAADDEDQLPVYQVSTDGRTLGALVRLCYPFAEVNRCIVGLRQLDEVVQLARVYQVKPVEDLIRKQFDVFSKSDPLGGYYIAMKWEWLSEADRAAKLACGNGYQLNYTWAMDQCGAYAYVRLLKYGHHLRTKTSSEWFSKVLNKLNSG